MAMLSRGRLSGRTVEALPVDRETVFWDPELPGFGVRVYPSGSKVYLVQTRGPGGSKRIALGRHGAVSAGEARRRAARVIQQLKAGERPTQPWLGHRNGGGPTVAEAAERYLDEYVEMRCKPSTVAMTRRIIRRHIVPSVGAMLLRNLEPRHAKRLHGELCATPAAANMVAGTLSRIFNFAERLGLVAEGSNPCRHVAMYKPGRRERFLTEGEYRRLGRALRDAETNGGASAHAVAAIRLLMLTGCRRNEILTLRWTDVCLASGEMRLRDSKTGPRTVPLSPAAVRVLSALPRAADNPWVIPGRRRGTHMRDIQDPWKAVRSRAGLDDVRLHDLRHSFASRALAHGESLTMIAKLLGHSQTRTAARYAHLEQGLVKDAAERIALSIAADALRKPAAGAGRVPGGTRPRHRSCPAPGERRDADGSGHPSR